MLEGFCVPVIPKDILSGAVTKLRLKEKERPSVSLNTIQEIYFFKHFLCNSEVHSSL